MREVVDRYAPVLKEAGFRKRRHCFNRAMPDGIVHVVYFWMAPKEPPAWTEVPGLRERLYGSFRLDVGIHVPEMNRSHEPRSTWINDYDCQLRRTIGQLISGNDQNDLWWRLDSPASSDAAGDGLAVHALPWLAQLPTKESILDAYDRVGSLAIGLSPAGALDIADLSRALGQPARERRVLEGYVASPVLRGHAEYLGKYLLDRGHGDLVERIAIRPS